MRKTYIYILTDAKGNEIIRGKKSVVVNRMGARYTYEHIFDDVITRIEG